jgi:hypothetical protein
MPIFMNLGWLFNKKLNKTIYLNCMHISESYLVDLKFGTTRVWYIFEKIIVQGSQKCFKIYFKSMESLDNELQILGFFKD